MSSRCAIDAARQREYVSALRKLAAEGIGVKVPDHWKANYTLCGLDVSIGPETTVCKLHNGIIGYRIHVRMVATHRIRLEECDIEVVWDSGIVPESFDDRKSVWYLGREGFSPGEVLNNRIESGLLLHSGKSIEGLILATGLKPIPKDKRTGSHAEISLTLRDSLSREMHVTATATVYQMPMAQEQTQNENRVAHPSSGSWFRSVL